MSGLFKAMANRLQNITRPAQQPAPSSFDEIVEGSARILHPKGATFYNPAQVVNRDLSVLILRHHARTCSRPLRILEALSATGLRSVRYFNEVPNVSQVLANDLDPVAVSTIRNTVLHNRLDPTENVIPNHADAAALMSASASTSSFFDVIDLDPYGTAAPFLEPAVRAAAPGGLLCVTCTDLPVLCGNSPEACYARYGATPLKTPTTHEMAVRIVFSAIQAAANRVGRAVEPVLCAKIDFYVRLFLRVTDSKSLAQRTPCFTSLVFQCVECGTQALQPLGRMREIPVGSASKRKRRRRESDPDVSKGDATAPGGASDASMEDDKSTPAKKEVHYKFSPANVLADVSSQCSTCGGNMVVGGPIWNGPLIGEGVAKSVLTDLNSGESPLRMKGRVEALVRLLDEEVRSVPLFMHIPTMCSTLNVRVPPAASIRSALLAKGYEVSQSHVNPGSLKTTAPAELVWDILRIWTKKVGSSTLRKLDMVDDSQEASKDRRRSVGERILVKRPHLIAKEDVDFEVKRDKFVRQANGSAKAAVRFPLNPEANWGPKARAGKRAREVEER